MFNITDGKCLRGLFREVFGGVTFNHIGGVYIDVLTEEDEDYIYPIVRAFSIGAH